MAFPFSRSLRLRSGWEFDLVFRTGRKIQGRLVRLFFVDAPDGITRVGVAVGKRQGGAVCRSRGKRVLREAFRHLLPLTKEGLWIVAMLRQSALGDSAARVYDDMRQVLFAEGLLRVSRMPVEWKVLRLSSRDSCEKCSGERR
ncbi:ribonuclease P protein component [Aminiphilus circumscriptus]|uniref:ribonuclease P protein component n=1 Tax=Aminiphilus circumscriptus TaxID=290732 RepID=UPI0004928A0E|nr:ribonuclease P protein component [Aminiphilus circumscriptus]